MSNQVRTYDPKQMVVTFGPVILSGWADGTFLSVSPGDDAFEMRRGADGSVDRTNKNVFDATVSFTLMATSPTNQQLSIIHEADKLTNGGVLPLAIKDLNGTTLFAFPQAWIVVAPDAESSNSPSDREWRLQTGKGVQNIGGNSGV